MESNVRIAAKAATWQASGLIVMAVVGFLFTGSLAAGGGLAVVSTAIGSISFFLHEKVWAQIRWGRSPNTPRPEDPA